MVCSAKTQQREKRIFFPFFQNGNANETNQIEYAEHAFSSWIAEMNFDLLFRFINAMWDFLLYFFPMKNNWKLP